MFVNKHTAGQKKNKTRPDQKLNILSQTNTARLSSLLPENLYFITEQNIVVLGE